MRLRDAVRPMARISPRRVSLLTIAGLSLAAPAAAAADIGPGGTCTGDPIVPDRVVTGTFPAALQGSYVMVPVTVPRGTEGVRVKYCYSQPAGPTTAGARNTLDLGLWDPRGFRGWGGSSHPDVTVSPLGFSSEAEYRADPRGDVPGRTTRGFVPGRVPPGSWEVELGVGGVLTPEQGNPSGTVDWRVEVDFLEALGPAAPPTARRATTARRRAARPGGTPATCTSTPSTPRWATRRCARSSSTPSGRCAAAAPGWTS